MKNGMIRLISVLAGTTAGLWGQVVESPTTVAPGAWLVEADIAAGTWEYGRRKGGRESTREVSVAPVIISTGIAENLDVQFAFGGWVETEEQVGGLRETASGWGDAWIRAKWNFLGNEDEESAWAVLPYLKLPVGDSEVGNGEFEGGVALLYGQPLPGKNWMEVFISADTLHSERGRRHEQVVGGVVWARDISTDTTIYTELLAEWISAAKETVPVVWGVGVSPVLAEGFALDFELLVGVTEEAPDWSAAVRLVWEL